MATDRQWVIVRIDGKIAAISTDYKALSSVASRLAKETKPGHSKIIAETVPFETVWELRCTARWEDFMLFGTDFQKNVWEKLYELTHSQENLEDGKPRLLSYSDFAGLCENRAGVRAVAHAVGLNPLAVVIPCHLVVPKESIDRIRNIRKRRRRPYSRETTSAWTKSFAIRPWISENIRLDGRSRGNSS